MAVGELLNSSRENLDEEATASPRLNDGEVLRVSVEADFKGFSVRGEGSASGLNISDVEGPSGICKMSPRDCLRSARDEPWCGFGKDEGSNHLAVGVGGRASGSALVICGMLLGETGTGVTGVGGMPEDEPGGVVT